MGFAKKTVYCKNLICTPKEGVHMKMTRMRIHNLSYYSLLGLLIFDSAIRNSQVLFSVYQKVEQIFTIIILAIILVTIINAQLKLSEFFILSFMVIIGILIYIRLGRMLFLYLTIILVFSEGKDLDKIGYLMLKILGGIFGFNLLCTIYFFLFDRGSLYIRIALQETRPQLDLSCGGHPNHAACFFVLLICIISYLYWERISVRYWMIISMLTIIIYYLIGSDAVFATFLLFAIWLIRNNVQFIYIFRKFIKFGIPIILVISLIFLWAQYIPGGTVMANWLNDISSGRFQLSVEAINRYPITFLGANTEFGHIEIGFNDSQYIYADNAYVYMLINSGIIYLILLTGILLQSADWLESKSVAVLVVYLCYGLAESNILSFNCLFPILVAVMHMKRNRIRFY